MKKIHILLFSGFISLACKAQTIEPLYPLPPDFPQNNDYYKDLDNVLNLFEGTWLWQDGNDSWELQLVKKEQVLIELGLKNYFRDLLIGEYRYLENGQEIINTLPQLNDNLFYSHTLAGGNILHKYSIPECPECDENELRLKLYFRDPGRDYISCAMFVRHRVVNGQEQLWLWTRREQSHIEPYIGAPNYTRIPFGEYVFIKQ